MPSVFTFFSECSKQKIPVLRVVIHLTQLLTYKATYWLHTKGKPVLSTAKHFLRTPWIYLNYSYYLNRPPAGYKVKSNNKFKHVFPEEGNSNSAKLQHAVAELPTYKQRHNLLDGSNSTSSLSSFISQLHYFVNVVLSTHLPDRLILKVETNPACKSICKQTNKTEMYNILDLGTDKLRLTTILY